MWEVGGFFFQAEDGIRDDLVTGVQTCALPILCVGAGPRVVFVDGRHAPSLSTPADLAAGVRAGSLASALRKIGRASCRERGETSVVAVDVAKKQRSKARGNGTA